MFESKLIRIVDGIVPLAEFCLNTIVEKPKKVIKNKINRRKRLLKQFKSRPSVDLKSRISNLNQEIRSHFFVKTKFKVRKDISLECLNLSIETFKVRCKELYLS